MNELVYLKNDEAVCSSLLVAEKFEKRHANVMRAIDSLVKNDSTQNCVQCFHTFFYLRIVYLTFYLQTVDRTLNGERIYTWTIRTWQARM